MRRSPYRPSVPALLALALLAGCAAGGEPTTAGEAGGETAPPRHRVADVSGVSVTIPAGWRVAPRRLTPNLINPLELISIGTGPLPGQGGDRCHHMPGRSLDAMGPAGAFLSLQEWHGAPADRRFFPARAAARRIDRNPVLGWVCARSPRVRVWWMPFRERRRTFYALAAAGPRASPATIGRLAIAVATIRIDRAVRA